MDGLGTEQAIHLKIVGFYKKYRVCDFSFNLLKSRKIKESMKTTQPLHPLIDFDAISVLSKNAMKQASSLRDSMLAPDLRKDPPVFNAVQLAELCHVDKPKVFYTAKKGVLPPGTKDGNRLIWTLAEARQWVRFFRADYLRDPQMAAGVVISVANFKGGVGKTTTATALAHGLSLKGHKVLIIDSDPQASATTLMGVFPDTDVANEQTLMPLCCGDEGSIMTAVRQTYWDGVDLLASNSGLYGAEFELPSRQMRERGFEFWRVLDLGLEDARKEYDIIIIDSPPSLGYLTVNALMAAQGVIMPLPPSALDFYSSIQFWKLYLEVCGPFQERGFDKKFHFIDVLLSRVDRTDSISSAVRAWIMKAYGENVLSFEILKTAAAASTSAAFGTIYDDSSSVLTAKTLKRARDSFGPFVEHIEMQVMGVWASDEQAMSQINAKDI